MVDKSSQLLMNPNIDYSKLVEIYHSKFLPAYSSLVTYVNKKPSQIRSELENILGHIMQTGNPRLTPNQQQINLRRAVCHVMRGTLDCYKLIWLQLQKRLNTIVGYGDLRKLVLEGINDAEFIQTYEKFRVVAQQARDYEQQNIGTDTVASIDKYYEATKIGESLLNKVNLDKVRIVKRMRWKLKWKELLAAFAGGIIATVVIQRMWF